MQGGGLTMQVGLVGAGRMGGGIKARWQNAGHEVVVYDTDPDRSDAPSVQGLGEIVAFQQKSSRGDKLARLSQRHISLRLPFFSELTKQHAVLEILTGLGGLAVVVAGAMLSQHGALDSGLLPLLTILAMAAFLPVSEIAQIGRQLADTLGATRRVYALANEPIPVRDGPGVPATSGAAALALEDVGFAYPGQSRRALSGVSFAPSPSARISFSSSSAQRVAKSSSDSPGRPAW